MQITIIASSDAVGLWGPNLQGTLLYNSINTEFEIGVSGTRKIRIFFPVETLVIGFSYQATQTVHPLLSTWLYTYDIHVDCLINSSINCCFLVLANWKKKNWIHFYLAVFFFFLQNTHTQIRNIENTVKNKPEYVIYSLIFTSFLASVTMTLIVAMWTFELQQL